LTESGWQVAPERQPAPKRTPVADLFDEAFGLYRRSFLTILLVFGAFEIPFVLANLPLTIQQARFSQTQWESNAFSFGGPEWSDAVGDQLLSYLLLVLATVLLAMLLLTLAAASVTLVVGMTRTGRQPRAAEVFVALREATPRLIGLIAVLAGGFVAISLLFVAAMLIVVVAFGANIGVTIGLILLIGLGLFVLLIFLGTRLAVSIPALVLERLSPMDAIRRSWSLVLGSSWRVLGVVYLAILLVAVLGGFAPMLLVPGLYQGLMTGTVASYVQLALVGGAVNLVLGPILPTLVAVVYFDLADRRPEAIA
jgi:hypothetical protein